MTKEEYKSDLENHLKELQKEVSVLLARVQAGAGPYDVSWTANTVMNRAGDIQDLASRVLKARVDR